MKKNTTTSSEDLYKLLLEDIRIADDKRFKVDKSVEKIRNTIIKGFEEQVFFETEGLGDPVSYKRAAEKSIMYYISTGDVAKVLSLIDHFDPTENHYKPGEFNDIGEVSENPLLQAMSMFVSGITLYTRAALDGGLPDHIAYSLSDNYIKYGLMITDISKLNHLQSCALYDFTYQVFGDVVVEEAPGVNVEITIPEGTSTMELASKLEMNRLVVNRYSFYIKVKLLNYKILAGTYHLNTSMTYDDIINTITNYANAIELPAGEDNK